MNGGKSLPEETGHLLRACWNLAKCLFSLQGKNTEQTLVDEELLRSAVNLYSPRASDFRDEMNQQSVKKSVEQRKHRMRRVVCKHKLTWDRTANHCWHKKRCVQSVGLIQSNFYAFVLH